MILRLFERLKCLLEWILELLTLKLVWFVEVEFAVLCAS